MSVFSLANVNMVNYLTYGPFSSFAPQYDSTWATLTKRDTDLLLRYLQPFVVIIPGSEHTVTDQPLPKSSA